MPYAETNGIKIYYESHGNGHPLVLLSGLGSTFESWSVQVPVYSDHFRVITPDNRGSGRSDKPDYPYTIEQMADDTVGLLDLLEIEKAHFAGKSMGGMITQWLGIKYPERVGKIVMGCTSAERDDVGNLILRMGRDITDGLGPGDGWLFALLLGYQRKYIEENYNELLSAAEKIPPDPDAFTGYRNQSYACENHNVVRELSGISAKTLIIYGEQDFLTPPKKSKRIAELIPDALEIAFPEAGHGFWKECQTEVDRTVLDFLLD